MSQIFEKNLKALFEVNPLLAAKVFGAKNEKFQLYAHKNDNANLNFINTEKKLPMYETVPLDEINKDLKKFEKYARYPVLFFFGLGNGILIKLLISKLKDRKIIVIEPDIEIIYVVLNLIDFAEEIKKQQLVLMEYEQFHYPEANTITSNPDILLFLKTYELHVNTPYYEKLYNKEILNTNRLFIRAIKQSVINFGNDTVDTLIGIEHSVQNFPEMLKNPPIQSLKHKKNSDYAIIVSTGPSLEKQLPLLKEIQNHATIISVDASMPILEKWDIVPDFVTSLERVKETASFFKQTSKAFQEKFITVHASLQHEDVLKNSYGKKILSMRGFAYNHFFNLPRYGYLGLGMSAANMAYELAYLLGFDKIVLIGQDLAYSKDGKSHASGHPYAHGYKDTDLYVTAYGGEGTVRTSDIWNMFKNFFERDIAELNLKGIKTINATEGGARIAGSIEIPFSDVIKEIPKTDKKKIIIKKPRPSTVDKNLIKVYKKIAKMLEIGQDVQKKIEKTFLKVAKECENLIELNEKKQLEKIDFDYLIKLSNEIDKIKTKIESKRFFQIYGETISSYLVNKEMDLAKIQVQNPQTDMERKAKLIDWIMNHKDWLFMLAGSINAQNVVIKRALPNIENELLSRNLPFTPIPKD